MLKAPLYEHLPAVVYHWYVEGSGWGRSGYTHSATRALDKVTDAVISGPIAERALMPVPFTVEYIAIQKVWAGGHDPALIRWPATREEADLYHGDTS